MPGSIKRDIGSAFFGKEYPKDYRAMKLVAAAKLCRAQEAMMEMRPYAEKYPLIRHFVE